MTTTTAPVLQPLTIEIGADFTAQVPFTDQATGDPIPVGSPKMQIRASDYPNAVTVITPALSASGNTITITISAAQSLTVTAEKISGVYDLFATRTDTNQVVKLLYGPVTFVENVTPLP